MPSRRQVLRSLVATGLVGLAGCADRTQSPTRTEPATATRTSTPTMGQDGELHDTTGPPERVGTERVLWESDYAYSAAAAPALVGSDRLLVGDTNGLVAGVTTAGGRVQWTYETALPVQTTPRTVGETGIVVEERYGEDAVLHGFGVDGGDPRWQFAPEEGRLEVLGTADGATFVATADRADGGGGGHLYALSVADGTVRWATEVRDGEGGLVADGGVYRPAGDALVAFATDGTRRWAYEVDDHMVGALAVAEDTVALVTSPERRQPVVHGVDAATGERRWTFDDWRAFSLRTTDDRLFVGGERLARLDPVTGTPRWVADLEVARLTPGQGEDRWIDDWRTALSEAVPVGDTLYVGGTSAAAVAVDDGAVRWETDHGAALAAPAGIADGTVVLHASAGPDDRDRHLLACNAATGDVQWRYAGRDRLTEPVVGENRVFFAESRTGTVALEL